MNPLLLQPRDDYDREVADAATQSVGEDFWEEVLHDIYRARDREARMRMALMRQARIKQQSDMFVERVSDTFGAPQYRIDRELYHAFAWRFRDKNDRRDYSCWSDSTFIRELCRDNEEVRVKVEKRMDRVGWTPARETRGKVTLTDRRGNAA